MKALSLAVLGLAGLGYGASAMAVCPTDPAQPAGPWTSKSTLGGSLAINTPGFNSTECRLDAQLTVNGPGGSASVRDNTPAAEPRYRARFFVNADALTGLNSIQSVKIFSANTDTPYLGISEAVKLSLFGNLSGTSKSLGVTVGCEGQPSNLCTASLPLTAGTNTVQIDWQKGASTTVKIWVNSTTEASPTQTFSSVNTNGWVVDYAVMGLTTASPGFRSAQLNKIVSFDEFDSRRTTFIN